MSGGERRLVTMTRSVADVLEIMQWARDAGALHIKCDDVEVMFPPEPLVSAPLPAPVDGKEPAPTANPLDDPDYAYNEWASFKPLPTE